MPKQLSMLADPYDKFSGFADDYPKFQFAPLHPAFVTTGRVHTGGRRPREFYVDLSLGECDCQKGVAWRWSDRDSKWFRNAFCSHKLRMMANIVDGKLASANVSEKRELYGAYLKALGTRYNPFELTSAFHKELRRGDFDTAWFFATLQSSKRSIRGVFEYLLNIIYEETRDHELATFLLDCFSDRRKHTFEHMSKAVSWFCASIKKWELPRRLSTFTAEMHGYRSLVKEYGREVARGSNIIPAHQKAKLLKDMIAGADAGNESKFQRGLKGLQKLQYLDQPGDDYARAASASKRDGALNDHRYWLYEQLYELADKAWPETDDRWGVIAFVNARIAADKGIGYHELNAIGDAVMGEPYGDGLLSPTRRDIAIKRPAAPVPLGKWVPIPLYAHDNHTWAGKALLKRFPDELKRGAKQENLDFRWCGAYFGVCYRMVAHAQHGRVADWHEVEWPKDLYDIVQTLWY